MGVRRVKIKSHQESFSWSHTFSRLVTFGPKKQKAKNYRVFPIIAPPPPQLSGQITYSPPPQHGNYTIMGVIISWGAIMGKTRIIRSSQKIAYIISSRRLYKNLLSLRNMDFVVCFDLWWPNPEMIRNVNCCERTEIVVNKYNIVMLNQIPTIAKWNHRWRKHIEQN